jgi:hypothetical protein
LKKRSGHNKFSQNSAGGKLFPFDNEHLLFSHGEYKTRVKAQDNSSVFGKIISINKNTKEWSIISKGHRNIQGLFYNSDKNFIINTEHGPFGGDEININDLNDLKEKNYGWPISSYGEHYGGIEKNKENYIEAPLYKSHSEHGFIEPTKYFVPSIGITDIKKISNKFIDDNYNLVKKIGAYGGKLSGAGGGGFLSFVVKKNLHKKIIYSLKKKNMQFFPIKAETSGSIII